MDSGDDVSHAALIYDRQALLHGILHVHLDASWEARDIEARSPRCDDVKARSSFFTTVVEL